ncbi:hypothetical protein F383_02683 [Gossypium arboreum]|uniref:Uncharacterized protein n=1 Tax=Gossypium arboreum TaxID=29729 RepID=A0A0B0PLM3_GOSAR|nr:hypothetical protein F383_02683 [Gossypium arboreum]
MSIKGGKLALQMVYFCPHGLVSQPCATHGYVTRLCVPWGTLRFKVSIPYSFDMA